jgi:hypothetical protein
MAYTQSDLAFLYRFRFFGFALGSQAVVIKFLLEARNCFFFFFCSTPALWLRNPYPVGSRSTFNGLKRLVRETHSSLPSSDKIQNGRSCISISKICLRDEQTKAVPFTYPIFYEF